MLHCASTCNSTSKCSISTCTPTGSPSSSSRTSSTSSTIQEGKMHFLTRKSKFSQLSNQWAADLYFCLIQTNILFTLQSHSNMYGDQPNSPYADQYPYIGTGMGSGQTMMINDQPVMGMAGGTGFFNNAFLYSGNSISLQTQLESLTPAQTSTLREATINCTGTQLTEMNVCCFVCTICWGVCLIFPLCFMCCEWWMRKTLPSFEVPQSTYQALQNLVSGTYIQNLTLTVVDNRFNAQKARILHEILSRSQLKGFTFVNAAGPYGFDNNEYSKFVENMRPIKMLPIASEIRWSSRVVG